MARMWNYCTTTQPANIEFLQTFARFMQDSKIFRVPTTFFETVGTLAPRLQAIRLCLSVAM
eukprot:4534505-Alexandrium_andersonii.AAC.1